MTEGTKTGYVEPDRLTITKDESNNLCVAIDGEGEWRKVAVKLAFPYSEPESFVALLADDEEVGIIRDLSELDEDSAALMREALQKRYHIPVIESIVSVDDAHNATRWTVETDRGRRSFLVRDRHNFLRIKHGDKIIIDVDGGRYRLPRERRYDKQSQKLLDLHG